MTNKKEIMRKAFVVTACLILTILIAGFGCIFLQPPATGSAPVKTIPESPKVWRALQLHYEELLQLPGVKRVTAGDWSIRVYTENPAVVPREVDGVPIETFSPGE